MGITELLANEALKFGQEHMIVRPGEVVMSDVGGKGILRAVKVVGVAVSLEACFLGQWNNMTKEFDNSTWGLEFVMQYCGQRLKKDGTTLGNKSTATYLDNFVTNGGSIFEYKRNRVHRTSFNHTALTWKILNAYCSEKKEYVC